MSEKPRKSPSWRLRITVGAVGAGVFILPGMGIGVAILLSGALSTAATRQHSRLTYWLLDTGLRYSIEANSGDIRVPSLAGGHRIRRGLACCRAHCAQCHGAPGVARDAPGLGMLPVPNDLTQTARDRPSKWLYYVTRYGVRMTGMPAWEFRLSEDDLWATVAFLKALPALTRAGYAELDRSTPPACAGAAALPAATDRERGAVVLRQYACHACHRIEGIVGPDTRVGPPLVDWPSRPYISGTLPNTRENLVLWITDPESVSPGTLMPDLRVPQAQARQVADYLFSQR